jgi:hypothetical protein
MAAALTIKLLSRQTSILQFNYSKVRMKVVMTLKNKDLKKMNSRLIHNQS